MAKATATCTCRVCGGTFEKSTTCRNRSEADSWEAWAVKNFDLCPSCYGKQKMQQEREAGLIAKVRFDAPFADTNDLWVVLYGDTYPIKDDIKALGGFYTDAYPDKDSFFANMLSTSRPLKRWCLRCPWDYEATGQKLAALGFEVQLPSESEEATYLVARQEHLDRKAAQQADDAAKQSAIDAQLADLGPKPEWPDDIKALWPTGAKWNCKIYGRKGSYCIYLNGDKIPLTDAQQSAMQSTYTARQEWEAKKKSIMEKE